MDLQTLTARTGVPIRRLRHCLDADLLPGLKIEVAEDRAGRPRKFHDDVGFFVAFAAALIGTGLDQATVRHFVRGLATITFANDSKRVIIAFFELRAQGWAELGDHQNIHVHYEIPGGSYDSGWVAPGNPARLDPRYGPRVIVRIDIGRLAAEVFGW